MRIPHLCDAALTSVVIGLSLLLTASTVAAQNDVAQAFRLDNSGRRDEAIALYRQVLARDSRSYDAHYGIARALDLKGNYSEARDHFARAIELAPDDGSRDQALRMMGVSWTFVGDGKQAVPFFKRVFDRRLNAADFPGAAEEANEIGRVLLDEERVFAEFLLQCASGVGAQISHHHFGAFAHERAGMRFAHATRGAGDDCDLAR